MVLMPFAARAAFQAPGRPSGFVDDFANILAPADRAALESKLAAFNASTTIEIAVVTVPSLGGDTIETAANAIFDDWKIGKEKQDNGVLVLVAPAEHLARIQPGYGLEGALTDLQASWILKNDMLPQFKNGAYYAGLDAGTDRIIAAVEGEAIPSDASEDKGFSGWSALIFFAFIGIRLLGIFLGRSKSWWLGGVLGGLAGLAVLFFEGVGIGIAAILIFAGIGTLIDFLASRSYGKWKSKGGRGPWLWGGGGHSGGGSSGGFGGFGGGSSGGGGASGSW